MTTETAEKMARAFSHKSHTTSSLKDLNIGKNSIKDEGGVKLAESMLIN